MISDRRWFVPLLILLSYPFKAQVAGEPAAATVDSLCLSEILISTPQPYDPAQIAAAEHKADSAREAIRQGAKFEDIAKKYSDGTSAVLGGALGWFKRGQLAKSIEDRVFAMKVGDVSDVIRTKQGFTILRVTDCHSVTGIGGASRPVEILSGMQGVDFEPYIRLITKKVEANWYRQIPLSAETKSGEVTIECAVATDGKITSMRLVADSGDAVLDRAALGALTKSSPFPPLPSQYTGAYLALRLHFHYNPDESQLN